jgi:hypothetical protein
VACPEDVEEVVVLAGGGVVLHADDLVVVGGAGADVLVGRVVDVALTVADLGAGHPGHALERELHAPEASRTELRELVPGHRLVLVGALRQRCRRLRRARAAAQPAKAQLPEPAHRREAPERRLGVRGREEADGGPVVGDGAVEGAAEARGEEERGGRGGRGEERRHRARLAFLFPFCGGVAWKLRRPIGGWLGFSSAFLSLAPLLGCLTFNRLRLCPCLAVRR